MPKESFALIEYYLPQLASVLSSILEDRYLVVIKNRNVLSNEWT